MIKVLFVCYGNICRSPMAEFVLKEMVHKQGLEHEFYISSAATSREEIGNDIHPGTRRKLLEEHIPFTKRMARQITKSDYEAYDYIFAMDAHNVANIRRIVGWDHKHKVKRLLAYTNYERDIADPWYTGDFDATYSDVVEGCQAFLSSIIDKNASIHA